MLLFNPSAGQIVDRLSILELKLSASSDKGFDISALEAEIQACHEALAKKSLPMGKALEYERLAQDLREQNQGQWKAEIAARELAKILLNTPTYEELFHCAKTISDRDQGNEVRAALVAAIDTLFNEVIERKMYR